MQSVSASSAGAESGPSALAIRVVGIGRETEPHGAGVALAAAGVKARETSGAAEREHQHAGRQRIERAEMADLAKSDQPAHGFDDVVRRLAARLIDHEDSVDGRRLGCSGIRRFCVQYALRRWISSRWTF